MEAVAGNPVLKTIELSRIDLENRFFKITFEASPSNGPQHWKADALKESIARIGLLSPPFLKSQPDNRYLIVSGFRRVSACRALGWQAMPAWVFGTESDDFHLMKIAIAENIQNIPLNIIEQATAISKLSSFFTDDVKLLKECGLIGLSVNPGLIRKLHHIQAAPYDLKNKMAAGDISLTVGLELMDMDEAARLKFLNIFEVLHPTLNHQKELIRMIREIAAIEERMISEIFAMVKIDDLANEPDTDRAVKIRRIRQLLKQRRYPEISGFEKAYYARIKRLNLPESVHLQPPADFEGKDFMMQCTFQDLSEFKKICDNFLLLRDHPDFKDILEKKREDN